MSLRLYFHPLSSFCQKVLVALYENGTPFTPQIVNLMDEGERTELVKLWPFGKFPVLRDEASGVIIPETSIIIEYLDQHFLGSTRFIPADPALAREVRLRDRIFDLYVNVPMQKIVTDKLRPEGQNDPFGVEEARKCLRTALDLIEADMDGNQWATGDQFTMADCAACPTLFYADKIMPFHETHPRTAAYFDRLAARPSYARVLSEAEPYFKMFPG
jgi:glutathione S-transferase